jgi:hypothetical protein
MKKIVLALMMVTSCASQAQAVKGQANVTNTVHNLSVTAPADPYFFPTSFYRTNEDEVCIFCHTPHGGSLDGPLWNRSNPTSAWTHYNSATLSAPLQALSATRAVGSESLLCLSCHDGSISVEHIINTSNDIGLPKNAGSSGSDTKIVGGIVPMARIGAGPYNPSTGTGDPAEGTGDLSDDHPISFSYDAVRWSVEYDTGAKAGQLRDAGTPGSVDMATAVGRGVKFFPPGNRLECSSCHDPHVDYSASSGQTDYAPFLITPNTGSALCQACHIK